MKTAERKTAISNGLILLSRLYREPITGLESYIQAFPIFDLSLLPENKDALFQSIFGFELYPHESIFLDNSGLVGGSSTDALISQYSAHRFNWVETPDHISNQLSFLAHIADDSQSYFLRNHLLRWLPPLVVALNQVKNPFYALVADLTWLLVTEVANSHSITLNDIVKSEALPNLDNEETSLREIVDFLLLPSRCGIWLSGGLLGKLGRDLNLPRGFGGRKTTLMNLFRSATQYGQTNQLLQELHKTTTWWSNEYMKLDPQQIITKSWRLQTQQTNQLLFQMMTISDKVASV